MKKRLLYITSNYIFWLLFFIAARIIFLFYYQNQTLYLPAKDWIETISRGFWFDLSAAAFATMIPSVYMVFSSHIRSGITRWVMHLYNMILLVALCSLTLIDITYFNVNGYRLASSPLPNIIKSAEIFLGSSQDFQIKHTSISLAMLLFFALGYFKNITHYLNNLNKRPILTPLFFIIISMALVIPARGGIKRVLTPGFAFFHKENIINHATMNVLWNILYSFVKHDTLMAEGRFMKESKSTALFNSFSIQVDENTKILSETKPNIVMWISDCISDKIIQNAADSSAISIWKNTIKPNIEFSNFYASGNKHTQGVMALLSSYPAFPNGSLMDLPEKYQEILFLASELRKAGYVAHLYLEEDISGTKQMSYFEKSGFNKIFTPDSLKLNDSINFASVVYEKFKIENIDTDKPVFALILPRKMPEKQVAKISFDEKEQLYDDDEYRTLVEADIRKQNTFIDSIKKVKHWNKTLMISTSACGNQMPEKTPNYAPASFQVPMFWFGGVVKKDTIINICADQTDFATTLLSQIDYIGQFSRYGANMLTKIERPYAYYAFQNGFGFINDSIQQVYEISGHRFLLKSGDKAPNELMYGKAIYDVIFSDIKN